MPVCVCSCLPDLMYYGILFLHTVHHTQHSVQVFLKHAPEEERELARNVFRKLIFKGRRNVSHITLNLVKSATSDIFVVHTVNAHECKLCTVYMYFSIRTCVCIRGLVD